MRGVPKCLGVRFWRVGTNFTIRQSHEVWLNFSKNCFRIIKNMKNYGENFRETQNFHENFRLMRGLWGK